MRTLIVILLTALVAGGAVFGAAKAGVLGGGSNMYSMAAPIRSEAVEAGKLIEVVTAPGNVEPETMVAISARVAARIIALPCEEGTEVTGSEGDPDSMVLVKLDSTDLEAALKSTQARRNAQAATIDVERARLAGQKADLIGMDANLRQKRLELSRNAELLSSKDVSQSLVDELQASVEQLEAQIESTKHSVAAATKNLEVLQFNLDAADADIDRAKDNLDYTTIRSPISGVVTKLNSEVGELAVVGTTNTPGTTIMEVADLSRMLLIAEVDEADIGGVQVGQKAKVRIQAYPDRVFEGTVQHIALTATLQPSKHFKVEILLDTGGERIYSGLTADVDIEIEHHEGALVVPSQSVLGRPVDELPSSVLEGSNIVDRSKTIAAVVYRVINGEAIATPVKIGANDATHTVILAGLEPGEKIVTGPYKVLEHLSHGQKVIEETEVDEAYRSTYFRMARMRSYQEENQRRRGPR